tara:strand:+ start:62 stop:289 length:228 start_codon:yes stop_codon:yes gene_type:complete
MDLDEEVLYWKKEFPDLELDEIREILDIMDIGSVKDEYWKNNPTLPESAVDKVVAQNGVASYEYHLYHSLNNEAS